MSDEVFDYAIIGAGVSGLTLAWLLTESPLRDRSILLVDGARDDDELRTLSFWSPGPMALEPLIRHRWSRLRIHVGGSDHVLPVHDHTYRTFFFADLQRAAKERLARRPRNLVVEGRVEALTQRAEDAAFVVRDRTYRARWVFDSRFHLKDLEVHPRYHLLRQHFHGWVIRTPRDAFTPDVATLLDFRADVPPGTGFFYVLPFSRREALVELVTLEPVEAEPMTRRYLAEVFGVDDVALVDRESGVSPMTEQPFDRRGGVRVRRIGVAAGRLKPSTGYALTRIVADCEAVVRSLQRHGHPFADAPTSRFHRLLDAVLLELWSSRPGVIPPVFGALFLNNPADRVLRFLDERATPGEVVRLILTLPKRPFLAAAWRCLLRNVRSRHGDGDGGSGSGRPRSGRHDDGGSWMGRRTWKRVSPGTDTTRRSPRWRWTTIR